MPRAIIDGDRVRITGFRNFKYRTRDDFDIHYEEREYQLSHLQSVDFYVSYWKIGPVGHTFVSFNFDNAEPLCISIETRPEVGEGFDPVASLFKQFELIYVIGDERDLVGLRVLHRNEDVFLYRLRMTPEASRRFLLAYLERVNELADRPEWYHLLSNSCTINIVRYANAAGRVGRLDFRHVLNGFVDRYLYLARRIDSDLPFEELRQRSWINDDVKAADGQPDFPAHPRLPAAASARVTNRRAAESKPLHREQNLPKAPFPIRLTDSAHSGSVFTAGGGSGCVRGRGRRRAGRARGARRRRRVRCGARIS